MLIKEVLLLLKQAALIREYFSKLKPVKYFGICRPCLERSTVTVTGTSVTALGEVLICPEGAIRSGFLQDIRHRSIPAANIGDFFSMPIFGKYQTTANSVSVLFENLGVFHYASSECQYNQSFRSNMKWFENGMPGPQKAQGRA